MSVFEKIYEIVRSIPRGKVASYGQIAVMAGYPRGAQMVGWALHQLGSPRGRISDTEGDPTPGSVPWHRIINARGEISTTCREHTAKLQAKLLKKEGIPVELTAEKVYKIDLNKYRWLYTPPSAMRN